jgi:hypothetical protein
METSVRKKKKKETTSRQTGNAVAGETSGVERIGARDLDQT